MPGFVKTNKQIKLLVLYALAQIEDPATFEELSEATMVDEGVNYFLLTQAVTELQIPKNIECNDGLYTLTQRGRVNIETCHMELPMTVREKCQSVVKDVNTQQKFRKYVKTDITMKDQGKAWLTLSVRNELESFYHLELLVESKEEAEKICKQFQKEPMTFYFATKDVTKKLTLPPQGEAEKS